MTFCSFQLFDVFISFCVFIESFPCAQSFLKFRVKMRERHETSSLSVGCGSGLGAFVAFPTRYFVFPSLLLLIPAIICKESPRCFRCFLRFYAFNTTDENPAGNETGVEGAGDGKESRGEGNNID